MAICLDQLLFPKPGVYRFVLLSDGRVIGEQTCRVLEKN
jgi:hypothetical protein